MKNLLIKIGKKSKKEFASQIHTNAERIIIELIDLC